MRAWSIASAIVLMTVAGGASSAPRTDPTDAARLAALTSGLTPGSPQRCVPTTLFSTRQATAVGSRLVFRVNLGLVYVNDATPGCEAAAQNDPVRIVGAGTTRVCSGALARTYTNVPVFRMSGSCTLGSFVPYRRP